jgi:hypothetical protein
MRGKKENIQSLSYISLSFAARLQIHVNFHENFGNVFKGKLLLDEQIE